jgi:pyridoxine 4-dehydrogenase
MITTTSVASLPNAAASGTFRLGDMTVHRLGFGTMRLTGPGIWGEPKDPHQARAVLRRALELGVNLLDTADSYGPEVAENLIAEALYPYPSGLVIATKGGLTRSGPDQWAPVGRPEYLRQCVEMSLRRLRVQRIDLYQLHRIDPNVPVEESLGALRDFQRQGKIRHLGLSEVTVAQIEQAQRVAPIVSVQNLYNLANRKAEDVVRYCEAHQLGFIPWFPIASGELAGRGGQLQTIAQRKGATPAQIAVAWLLKRSPVMLPIPGTSSVGHLEENLGAASVAPSPDEFHELERIAPSTAGESS